MDLDYPKESLQGKTQRAQYLQALENPKLKPSIRKELEEKVGPPDIPDEYIELWEIFWELFSGERMAYADIWAYCQLYEITFSNTELNLLRLMDDVACKYISDEMKKKTPTPNKGK